MNCARFQQTLLASERPEQPAPALRQHLVGCPSCQGWQQRLVAAERDLPLLPVPLSQARAHFVQLVLEGEAIKPEPAPVLRSIWLDSHKPLAKERGLRKLAVAFALAAALVVFAVGFWAWQREQPMVAPSPQPPGDTLAERQQQRDARLSTARTPRERVEIVADIADKLQHELQALSRTADGERLKMLADFYGQLIRDDLLNYARQVPAAERRGLDVIATQLNATESELLRLLARDQTMSVVATAPLQEVARAAREGHDELRKLLHV